MTAGWDQSAEAWIDVIGDVGDWRRRHMPDAPILARFDTALVKDAVDIGCGEGWHWRIMRDRADHPHRVPNFLVIEWERQR